MKVLIVSDCYKPTINGVVTSVLNLKAGLEELGHEVRVLTLSNSTTSYKEDEVYYIGSLDLGKMYPGVVRVQIMPSKNEIADIISWKPDIVHTQSEFSTFFIAKRIAKQLKIPIIHTYHTVYEDYTHYFSTSKTIGKKAVAKVTNLYSEKVDGIVAPTQKINSMLDRYGVSCPVHIIPTGISLEKFQSKISDEEINKLKQSLGIPPDNIVLVSVSRLGKEKNIDNLINYLHKYQNKKISFVIVGDGPAKESLEDLTEKLNLSSQIVLTGSIPPDSVPQYYQMADLFVSASTSETQGLTYIEALASGTPILCRKDTCLDGVLEEYKNGYSFENEMEFTQKLDLYMSSKDNSEMVNNAVNTAEKFTTENFAKAVVDLYQFYLNYNNKGHYITDEE
ncbi:MAG: glycosyltransferase family 4 protein [Clostridia bacterium]